MHQMLVISHLKILESCSYHLQLISYTRSKVSKSLASYALDVVARIGCIVPSSWVPWLVERTLLRLD